MDSQYTDRQKMRYHWMLFHHQAHDHKCSTLIFKKRYTLVGRAVFVLGGRRGERKVFQAN